MSRICLVTPGHPSKNPRLVKEADALVEAGFDVQVVAGNYHSWGHDADQQYAGREWAMERVSYGPMASILRRAFLSGRKRISKLLVDTLPIDSRELRLRAYHWAIPELIENTRLFTADLYVAHYLPALPAVLRAAEENEAKAGFDAEDYHRGQFLNKKKDGREATLTRWMEETYIPQCDYITAASPGIGSAYADLLDIPRPTTVLNVFPPQQRSGTTSSAELQRERPADGISLYWYSQTIGENRGLETVVRAMGTVRQVRQQSKPEVTLSLRGSWADGYEKELRSLAQSVGLEDGQIRHLPRASPDQLIERAAQHDIGLALEQVELEARDLCITNKIFAYLLAGLPVLATNTRGQQYVQQKAPEAVMLCPVGDVDEMADRILRWVRSPVERSRAADAATQAASERFNWSVEKETFLSKVRSVLNR